MPPNRRAKASKASKASPAEDPISSSPPELPISVESSSEPAPKARKPGPKPKVYMVTANVTIQLDRQRHPIAVKPVNLDWYNIFRDDYNSISGIAIKLVEGYARRRKMTWMLLDGKTREREEESRGSPTKTTASGPGRYTGGTWEQEEAKGYGHIRHA
ncbi:uncharacterized protein BP5553_09343 [Venustampulla echinocandica]|uniref:Uncharacterized protein n=1 Tax=Venustampulla echinocandica TaxID=2656787 RepID=A0A370TCJ2_9HELO|nr:uncharacterized protein BP5553_09343 [Venustampulla echinocandica]RDL31941.1 hypothetical protein BP5553_09343 [Venustampulla echinocandica]